jgi:hypothetical protein
MRRVRATGYDLNDKIPSPKALPATSMSIMISPTGTKRTGISNDKKVTLPEIAVATSASGLLNLAN